MLTAKLRQAHNAAGVTLDFVSLLLSKDTPVQASVSISPPIRDAVALGTLGADKVQDPRVTTAQIQDDCRIAKGWKLQGLTDSVDSILESAARLEREMEKETQYWEQVLTISESGWAVCRLPQERHTLGVRFGFAECMGHSYILTPHANLYPLAAPAFNNRSLGALRRNVDGTIFLDQRIADSTPKRVRIRIQINGITTGASSSFEPIRTPSSIESSILSARNTIFEEELWQELNREARILANQGVRVIGDEVVCRMNGNKRIVLDLQAAEDNGLQHEVEGPKEDDTLAEMISLSLRLLLSYAHRQNHHRRSRPPPPITSRPPTRVPYSLLRPIIMRLHHEAVVSSLMSLLTPLSKVLISAGVCDSAYTMTAASVASTIEAKAKSAKYTPPLPEQTIEALISHLSAEVTIPLTRPPFPSQSLTIQLLTPLLTLETRFRATVTGPLAISCKPPPNPSTIDEVKGYIMWATSCALAGAVVEYSQSLSADGVAVEAGQANTRSEDNHKGDELNSGLAGWQLTHNPTVLRKSFKNERESKELAFKVISVPGEQNLVKVKALYKFVNGQQLVARESGAIINVWSSGAASGDTAGQQNEEKQEHIQLRKFVESVGKWSKTPLDTTYGLGDGYEQTGFEWA